MLLKYIKQAEVHGDLQFFDFLMKPTKRFSRFEAYVYMLKKASERYRPARIQPKSIPEIGEGQFFTTVSELARDFGANRVTVREFLRKLVCYGHLVMQKNTRGILMTMTHLNIPANPAVAIRYSFDGMAKFAMHSWGRGEIGADQVEDIALQMTRSARAMAGEQCLAGGDGRHVEEVTRLLLHYALEAAVSRLPKTSALSYTVMDYMPRMEACAPELFCGWLGGSWKALLALLEGRTELSLLWIATGACMENWADRISVWDSLRETAIGMTGLDLSQSGADTDTACQEDPDGGLDEDVPDGPTGDISLMEVQGAEESVSGASLAGESWDGQRETKRR